MALWSRSPETSRAYSGLLDTIPPMVGTSLTMEVEIRRPGLLDTFRESRKGWLGFSEYLTKAQGGVAHIPAPFRQLYYVSHSALIQELLVRNQAKLGRSYFHELLTTLFGLGIICSGGELWKRQRRLLQPLFTKASIRSYGPTVAKLVKETVDNLGQSAGKGEVEVTHHLLNFSVRAIIECVLGRTERRDWKELSDYIQRFSELIEEITSQPIQLPLSVPTPLNLKLKRCASEFTAEIKDLIVKLESMPPTEAGADMVRRLKDDPSQSAQQILDEVRTIFIAGHDTTATTLSWAIVLLGQNLDRQAELAAALQSIDLEDIEAVLDCLPIKQFVFETLRLYPTAWTYTRQATEPIEALGITIPQGATILFDLYHSHRDPAFFDEPEQFVPTRFGAKRSEQPQFYMPFGAGSRLCIGNNLALAQMRLFIAELVSRYRVELGPSFQYSVEGRITLRPEHGVPVILTPHEVPPTTV